MPCSSYSSLSFWVGLLRAQLSLSCLRIPPDTRHHQLLGRHSLLHLHRPSNHSIHCLSPSPVSVLNTTTLHHFCRRQLRTGPVSSTQTHTSIVHTPLFTSYLIVVPSRLFRMCGLPSSPHHDKLPRGHEGLGRARTPEFDASTDSFIRLERVSSSLPPFSTCCNSVLWLAIVLQLHIKKQCSAMT